MKFNKKQAALLLGLFFVLCIGGFLRFYKVEEVPTGVYLDEAMIGYNAYSFLQTGKDELGKSFPIFLRSYSVYAPPLYTYLTILSLRFIGFSILAVRSLSIVSGIAAILFVFLIFERLKVFKNSLIPLVGSFLFATAPWSIFFSRGAFETNLALVLLFASIYFYLRSKESPSFLIPASIILSLSTYAYHSQRLIAWLLLPIIYIFFLGHRSIRDYIKGKVFLSLLLFALIQIPQILIFLTPAFRARAEGLFYGDVVLIGSRKLPGVFPDLLSWFLVFTREFFSRLVTYFSPRNLFFCPDSDLQRSLPEMSVLFSWMVIPYLLGVYTIFTKIKEKSIQLLLLLAFIFAIPASLARDPFSSLRSLPLVLPVLATICLGIEKIVFWIPKKLWIPLTFIIIAGSGLLFWRSYFALFPNERAYIWRYGYPELVEIIKSKPQTHFLINVVGEEPVYIELAFHLKYPPEKLQGTVDPSLKDNYYQETDFNPHYQFANIETRRIKWEEDIYKDQILVGDSLAISESQAKEHYLTEVFQIRSPINEIIFQGFKTNPKEKCAKTQNSSPLCKPLSN